MSDSHGVDFEIMKTGVPNLDLVLGGGLPTGSFNVIAGRPGTGKTILSQQIMFHTATPERQALHFTVLGEPVAKLLRYQSRFSFFDPSKVNTAVHAQISRISDLLVEVDARRLFIDGINMLETVERDPYLRRQLIDHVIAAFRREGMSVYFSY